MTTRPQSPYKHSLPEVSIEENRAANTFRKTLVPRADDPTNLLWHGWTLFDAFIAGTRWRQQRDKRVRPMTDLPPEFPPRHWRWVVRNEPVFVGLAASVLIVFVVRFLAWCWS